jgi:hypothetical protein
MTGFPFSSRGTGCIRRVVTLTFGFRFRFGGAEMTVVVPEERCRRLTPAITDFIWNGDAFRDILRGDALGERAIGAMGNGN